MLRTYSELMLLPTFEERFEYLKLEGNVGQSIFGFDRYLNQVFYTSKEWRRTRRNIILRDNGCDLGVEDYEIKSMMIIHHVNPVTIEDIELRRPWILDPEFLITTSEMTHKAITYSDINLLPKPLVERRPYDTCPWR